MDDLIARLEAAEGPDRMLDRDIAFAVTTKTTKIGERNVPTVHGAVPKFTASIDAALTLKPAGWEWWAEWARGKSVWSVAERAGGTDPICGTAATPAIALCVAALRARSTAAPGDAHHEAP